jgi:hypothetical protein
MSIISIFGVLHSTTIAQTSLLPTSVWGYQYPLAQFDTEQRDEISRQYQIVASQNGTIVNVSVDSKYYQYQLNANEYLQLNVSGDAMLTANYRIQLVQIGEVSCCDCAHIITFDSTFFISVYCKL